MKKLEKLMAELPELLDFKYDRDLKEFVEVRRKPKAFIRDGMLFISGEYGDNAMDYFNNWINPDLEAFAKKAGGYFEFYDGGSIVLAL